MIIIGQGALTRPDGAAVLAVIGDTGGLARRRQGGWNGFNILHTAASRSPRSISASCRARAAWMPAPCSRQGRDRLSVSARRRRVRRAGRAFVVYHGSHGDPGAHHADVILPGAAYPEKDGLYVNFEGRVQMAERAAFPPGDAKEDWAILRALSDVLGKTLPYDRSPACGARCHAAHPHMMRIGAIAPGMRRYRQARQARQARRSLDKAPFKPAIADYYLTNPIARATATMAECSAPPLRRPRIRRRWRRSRRPMDFFWTYLWPVIVIVAASVLLLVVLLVAIAYILLADRKIWAAVQMRRGPNVVGPFGLLQTFADAFKFLFKEPVIPAGANKVCSCWRRWSPACWPSPPGR